MEKNNIKIDYDKEEDMLHLSKRESNVKFSFDIDLPNGDIILDFGFNGQIVGLEFFNASNYFPFLKNIKNQKIKGKMSVQYGLNWAQVFYEVHIPGKKPISNSLISPYNRELVMKH
ncbi:MAG: DUF2283 domain-containing protein [Nanoarchaeota archaeon]|nr:DUF2283 domain-containing protein [Nanoarchaeota archaeon]MBU4116451.1 DUF2283 domain-containing protein [Nanoarchaeota archaeon]